MALRSTTNEFNFYKDLFFNFQDASPSGLFGWVKGTGGGLLSKVAERTKSSVESVITTLDPQMKVRRLKLKNPGGWCKG